MKLFPRLLLYKEQSGKLISLRWLGTGFDYLSKEGSVFVQIGNKPTKFFYYAPKEVPLPLFLVSVGWSIKGRLWGARVGYTRRPLDLVKAWRNQCKRDLEHSENMTTKTGLTNYGTGSATRVKG